MSKEIAATRMTDNGVTRVFVKHAPDVKGLWHVPTKGRPLPDEGDWWPEDGFTQRRLNEGGLVYADPPK